MPSSVKGKNVYQGSVAVQQAASRDVGHDGESSGLSQANIAGSVIGEFEDGTITSRNPPSDNDNDLYGPPSLPPPTPSPSKQPFSALESVESSQGQSSISAPTGVSPTPHPAKATSAK